MKDEAVRGDGFLRLVGGAPERSDLGEAAARSPTPAIRVQPRSRKFRPAAVRVISQVRREMTAAVRLPMRFFVNQGQVQVRFGHLRRRRQRAPKFVHGPIEIAQAIANATEVEMRQRVAAVNLYGDAEGVAGLLQTPEM